MSTKKRTISNPDNRALHQLFIQPANSKRQSSKLNPRKIHKRKEDRQKKIEITTGKRQTDRKEDKIGMKTPTRN